MYYTLMGLVNFGIAIAYLTIGLFIAPRLKITPKVAQILAAGVCLMCAFTHLTLAVESFVHSTSWLVSPSMFVIQGLQFLVGWAFIIIAGPIIRIFDRLEREQHVADERLKHVNGSSY